MASGCFSWGGAGQARVCLASTSPAKLRLTMLTHITLFSVLRALVTGLVLTVLLWLAVSGGRLPSFGGGEPAQNDAPAETDTFETSVLSNNTMSSNNTTLSENPGSLEDSGPLENPAPAQDADKIASSVIRSAFTTDQAFIPLSYYLTTVSKIIDGDTIVAKVENKDYSIRLIGIDTPETTPDNLECGGPEATAFLNSVIPEGTPIWLTRDTEPYDIYDRLLAYVYRAQDGLFINLALTKYGYADELNIAPNNTYTAHFRSATARARNAGLGFWGACANS